MYFLEVLEAHQSETSIGPSFCLLRLVLGVANIWLACPPEWSIYSLASTAWSSHGSNPLLLFNGSLYQPLGCPFFRYRNILFGRDYYPFLRLSHFRSGFFSWQHRCINSSIFTSQEASYWRCPSFDSVHVDRPCWDLGSQWNAKQWRS
jgi:hypothetical protein